MPNIIASFIIPALRQLGYKFMKKIDSFLKKYILRHTIIPAGGIGNRVRVILSAMQWQNDTGKKVRILWLPDKGLACTFNKLFMPIEEVKEIKNLFWYKVFRKIYLHSPMRFIYAFNYNENEKLKNWIKNPRGILYCSSCSDFYIGKSPKFCDVFELSPNLKSQLYKIVNNFDANVIGVHIRRTDNVEAIKYSPVQKFIDYIKSAIASNDDLKFYLATDDVDVKNDLIKMSGDKIISMNYVLRRDTEDGIIGALLELYTLASCSKIIGSYYSSYSQLAAEIGEIKLEIL